MGESLRAQGAWTAAFDHIPDNHALPPGVMMVDPASDSITHPGRWITMNLPANAQITPGQGMNTVHVCLIPSGLHRGEVLVVDGNLTNYGVRAYQPWSIVNPWWPAANPNPWPGQTSQYRFHNATIAMPTQGDLFCGGQCWMPDGRLLFAGGTTAYASTTQGWIGARFVYQWDHTPQAGDPFGKWWQMADLEAERWYPTVIYDGTTAYRGIVIGGTNWTPAHGTMEVNSYEVVRPATFSPGNPVLLTPPNDFDRKPPSGPFGSGTTPVGWPIGLPLPAPSRRQYWGPHVPAPISQQAFGDYPRIHALGILDPIPGGGTAPRLFVSGFPSWGVRWAHDINYDPGFGTALTPAGQGYEIGQYQAVVDTRVLYPTSLLLPAAAGGISKQVARIGGGRIPSLQASNLVETVQVDSLPAFWKTMPAMNTRRLQGNVVILPTGELFAIGGMTLMNGGHSLIPELFVGGTTWTPMAAHTCPRDYHSAAILLPDARVFVCGGENRKNGFPGTDYAIWEPPYFHYDYGSMPPTGIRVMNTTTSALVHQDQIGNLGMQYGQAYIASWTNTLEPGIAVTSVVLMRAAAVTHHDDGGQRMVRLVVWEDETANSINFMSPASVLHAPPGWWMMFLVTSSGRPSHAYWVHLL